MTGTSLKLQLTWIDFTSSLQRHFRPAPEPSPASTAHHPHGHPHRSAAVSPRPAHRPHPPSRTNSTTELLKKDPSLAIPPSAALPASQPGFYAHPHLSNTESALPSYLDPTLPRKSTYLPSFPALHHHHHHHHTPNHAAPSCTTALRTRLRQSWHRQTRRQQVVLVAGLVLLIASLVTGITLALLPHEFDYGGDGEGGGGIGTRVRTTATFHAEYAGAGLVSVEENLAAMGCIDHYAGLGHDASEAIALTTPIFQSMLPHVTSSRHPSLPCGTCLKLLNPNPPLPGGEPQGTPQYVSVIDVGGTWLDLHPEIFYRLFGRDESAPVAEGYWGDEERAERYRGMGGVPEVVVEVVEGGNCQGWVGRGEDKVPGT